MRHIDTAARSLVAIGALIGSLALTGVALASRGSEAPAASKHRHELVEDRSCAARREHPPTGSTPAAPATRSGQTISVTVPSVTLIRLNPKGRPTWATTNTGCAPSATDLVYLVQRDGTLVEAPGFDVTKVQWHGDFRDGGPVPQDD